LTSPEAIFLCLRGIVRQAVGIVNDLLAACAFRDPARRRR
jgi:hypothetical protein